MWRLLLVCDKTCFAKMIQVEYLFYWDSSASGVLTVNYVNKGIMFSLHHLDIACISMVQNAFQNRGPFLGDESYEIEV